MPDLQKPLSFLKVRVHDIAAKPSITGLCVGYERDAWRASQFARHIIEWLPEFALKHAELNDMNSGNAVQMIRDAAKRVYQSRKFENRGEFGERSSMLRFGRCLIPIRQSQKSTTRLH